MATETETPFWLDEQFIEKALRNVERNHVKIKTIKAQAATSPGDNYASKMYRVAVEYDSHSGNDVKGGTKSLIVKAIPDDEHLKKLLTENDAFTRESEILMTIVPELHRLLKSSVPDMHVTLGPKSYFSSSKPHQKLVMEDLCPLGFKMGTRVPGLDLEHCKLVVSRLGVFHAASVALLAQRPEIFDNFHTHIYVMNGDAMRIFVTQSFEAVAEKAQTWPEETRKYSEKLSHLGKIGTDSLLKTLQRDDQGFNVLNHGDPWTNNMMFKYNDDGKLFDMVFLDFQCSYYGSPTLDLLYFLYTSPTPQVRTNNLNELLESYHCSLSNTLARLGYEHQCPSLTEIQNDMKGRKFMGMFAFVCVKPFASADPDSLPDLNTITVESSEKASSGHLTEDYARDLQSVLPIFEKEGLFE